MAAQSVYSFEMFEMHDMEGNAAPQREVREPARTNITRVISKSAGQKAAQERLTVVRMAVMLFVTLIIFCTIGLQISVGAQRYELVRQIASMEIRAQEAKSENKRLNSELQGMTSISVIDTYATEVLGMSKTENYQVEYIDLTSGDAIIYSGSGN